MFGTQTSRSIILSKGKAFLSAWFPLYALGSAWMLLSPV